ncbi:hypothetical protein PTSG_02654 [Salpingoeca rosetta]|uniref:ABC-2 type transporter transmembrane domain-containing protein n=1 Tax=Salpingoeca rosetta (strain ATCC 50818 / BSB-021) TaxID=946362 RepID=F2U2X6_SALR5|nr:uncharacterized protein PTSG_02654 [Salpingoeca rosetta]EGD81970.1 hypothetical protein PTSG_02654 [Salpingoeca rosetta]|eukprot:XP_004996153.1 hypothetical protein PTSG_02654 [Salpingoeca rosetta]
MATLASASVLGISFMFGGLFLPGPDMPEGYRWLWYANYIRYALNAMVVPQFHCEGAGNATGTCPTIPIVTVEGVRDMAVSEYVHTFLGLDYEDRWLGLFIVVGFACAFLVLSFLAARFINHFDFAAMILAMRFRRALQE